MWTEVEWGTSIFDWQPTLASEVFLAAGKCLNDRENASFEVKYWKIFTNFQEKFSLFISKKLDETEDRLILSMLQNSAFNVEWMKLKRESTISIAEILSKMS